MCQGLAVDMFSRTFAEDLRFDAPDTCYVCYETIVEGGRWFGPFCIAFTSGPLSFELPLIRRFFGGAWHSSLRFPRRPRPRWSRRACCGVGRPHHSLLFAGR